MNGHARQIADGDALDDVLAAYRERLVAMAPLLARLLRKGLKEAQIRAAIANWEKEEECEFPLPDSLLPLFKRFDGQRGTKAALLPPPSGTECGLALGALEFVDAWRSSSRGLIYLCRNLDWYKSAQIGAGVRRDVWNDQWLPFAKGERDGIDIMLLVDLAPSDEGRMGQVVLDLTRADEGLVHLERRVVASSLVAYFTDVVELMADGRVMYDAKRGLCHRAD
jgi:cell wall assembly regulator SMI1